ncbi:uncharacterized protein C1orf50 homolog [Nilaparvata lugens]|uniref:uncharacterized protein C1orf50 homolog n=1 Tax=Nilaparvata lugens TaxID=108931 RepID=UPI00193E63D6|nr:uncharacterized protein C1orf50 homolog [Nilaparvata lugens]
MKRSFEFNNIVAPETHSKVQLVERNAEPCGLKLNNVTSDIRDVSLEIAALSGELAKADQLAQTVAFGKLEMVAEQLKFLKSQTYSVVVKLREGLSLNHVACNFKKIPGSIYHLYQRPSGQKYFSMLSPEEWNGAAPHDFLGSFRLEQDMTWTPASEIEARDASREPSLKLLKAAILSEPNCDAICDKMVID